MILSFITNDPIMATYVQAAGIDRIMIDLEVKDKNIRQSGRNLFYQIIRSLIFQQ